MALVVEDSTAVALLLLETLGAQGGDSLKITHTETLAGAAALLEQQQFDVILLGLSLPNSTGMDTIDRVRSLAPGTPILALHSADDETIRENVLRRGAENCLVKGDASTEAIIKAIHATAGGRLFGIALDGEGNVWATCVGGGYRIESSTLIEGAIAAGHCSSTAAWRENYLKWSFIRLGRPISTPHKFWYDAGALPTSWPIMACIRQSGAYSDQWVRDLRRAGPRSVRRPAARRAVSGNR